MKTRVLHLNHTALISGAEHSLLALLTERALDDTAVLACPSGQLADRAHALGVQVVRIPAVDLSFKPHAINTPAGVASLAAAGVAARQHAHRMDADVIHANSIRAGMIAMVARMLGGPPTVTHIRDVLPTSFASSLVRGALTTRSTHLVATSRYVAERFLTQPRDGHLSIVDNPVDLQRFSPSGHLRAVTRTELAIPADIPVLAVIAQLTPWKGQDDAVRALAHLRERQPDARLLIVGGATFVGRSTRFDNQRYERNLHSLVRQLGLGDAVDFLGSRDDPERIMAAIDLLLVPSHEEPFGRTIIEAMAMGVPVLATEVGGPPEIIRPIVDGMLLPPRQPRRWAEACLELLDQPRSQANRLDSREYAAKRFSVKRHAEAMGEVFAQAVAHR